MLGCLKPLIRAFLLGALVLPLIAARSTAYAGTDTTPPATYLNYTGTLSASGWYVSTVDVNLSANDLQSGPASTTYQLDANSPVTKNFTTTDNAILNPSFEDGVLPDINYWDKGSTDANYVTHLYQSYQPARFGYRAASITPLSDQYYFWTNRNSAVHVSSNTGYDTQVWVKTMGIPTTGGGAWAEVWGSNSSSAMSDVLLKQSPVLTGDSTSSDGTGWILLDLPFTVPSGYNEVYLKLGAQSDGGQVWYDGATMYTGSAVVTQFTILPDGQHALTYFSQDNAGNIETTNTAPLIKIDKTDPQDWGTLSKGTFGYSNCGNAHTWCLYTQVRDVTSGINPATAMYRAYDVGNCDCWSTWQPLTNNTDGTTASTPGSITRIDTGQPPAAGYTGFVKLAPPPVDYGDNALSNTPQVQFRIYDVASSDGDSPYYALWGPWTQLLGNGDVYSNAGMSLAGSPPAGTYNATGVVAANGPIYNFTTSTGWLDQSYPWSSTLTGLAQYLPHYDRLLSQAQSLPNNKLPTASGVYLSSGNFTIDRNTLTTNFTNAKLSTVIIINGNLTINQDFSLASGAATLFLVNGNAVFSCTANNTAGMIIATGTINTGGCTNQLVHAGGVVASGGFVLGRDLGKRTNPTKPAEQFSLPLSYFDNQAFAQLVSGSTDLEWQELP